ncbi:MAG: hypothetical protein HY661_19595 [Betaproteobacteria bacterium]|nr:hypothetical protein [Betaproteobacteria bacterium]
MTPVDKGVAASQPDQSSSGLSDWFWRVVAVLIVLFVAWVIWVMWQITPRSIVTDQALQSSQRGQPEKPAPR